MSEYRNANHQARRQWIILVTKKIIADKGIGGMTIRRIADEMGFSTAAITHYFDSKDELLLACYRQLADESRKHFELRFTRNPKDLLGHLYSISPTSNDLIDLWRTYCAFWGRVDICSDLTLEREMSRKRCQRQIECFLRELWPLGSDLDRVARRVVWIVNGLAGERQQNPQTMTQQEFLSELTQHLKAIIPDGIVNQAAFNSRPVHKAL